MKIEISDRCSGALCESYDKYFTAMTEYSGKVAMDLNDFTETILLVGMLNYEKQLDSLESASD